MLFQWIMSCFVFSKGRKKNHKQNSKDENGQQKKKRTKENCVANTPGNAKKNRRKIKWFHLQMENEAMLNDINHCTSWTHGSLVVWISFCYIYFSFLFFYNSPNAEQHMLGIFSINFSRIRNEIAFNSVQLKTIF